MCPRRGWSFMRLMLSLAAVSEVLAGLELLRSKTVKMLGLLPLNTKSSVFKALSQFCVRKVIILKNVEEQRDFFPPFNPLASQFCICKKRTIYCYSWKWSCVLCSSWIMQMLCDAPYSSKAYKEANNAIVRAQPQPRREGKGWEIFPREEMQVKHWAVVLQANVISPLPSFQWTKQGILKKYDLWEVQDLNSHA